MFTSVKTNRGTEKVRCRSQKRLRAISAEFVGAILKLNLEQQLLSLVRLIIFLPRICLRHRKEKILMDKF